LTTVTAAHFLDAYTNIFGEFVTVSAQMKTQYPTVKSPMLEDSERIVNRTSEDQLLFHGETTQGVMSGFHFRGSTAQTGVRGFHWEIHGETGSILLTGAMGNPGAFAPDIFLNGKMLDLPEDELSNIGKEYLHYALNDGSLDFDHGVLRHKMVQSIYESARTGKRTSYL
jgi:predicted dehydrogenase